jgi:hypothetical protein
MGEFGLQYEGTVPRDSSVDQYFALARKTSKRKRIERV